MDELTQQGVADDAGSTADSDSAPTFVPHPLEFTQVRIENTNHCGYKCFMCPREKQSRDLGFMSVDDLALVMDRIGEHRGQIHLHGFGEPLLDKKLPEKARLVKERCPDAQILFYTTLGVKKGEAYFRELASAGLSQVHVSFYGFSREAYKTVARVDTFELAKTNLRLLAEARAAVGARFGIVLRTWADPVWQKWPEDVKKERAVFKRWAEEIGVELNELDEVHNYGDGRGYNEPPTEGLCSVAWGLRQRILQVTWNLDVIPCCFDFNASIVFGNLRQQTVEDVFAGESYRAFIEAHLANDLRGYTVCEGCERCLRP